MVKKYLIMFFLNTIVNFHVLIVRFLCSQGANASQLEKEIGPHEFPQNEHYFGLVNVSLIDDSCTIALIETI